MTKYFSFNGFATRSEYWAVMVIAFVLSVINGGIAGFCSRVGELSDDPFSLIFGLILIILTLFFSVWVTLATAARRCRDAGISPWWTLATMIPYISWIPIIVFGCLNSESKN